jgi:hypothetical protein
MNAGPSEQQGCAARARTGQMTAVMRAISLVDGPKVLRVGVLRGGRVLEERVLKSRATVTVGASEAATFVIASSLVPPLFPLFERVGPDLFLNHRQGMTGRLALASGIAELPAGNGRLKLGEDARGKVVIGETTFLFQFVAPPPAQPRPQLPLGVKGGLATSNDWALTLIAAFSFLVHFGVVGAMYSDWADPIVGDRYDVAGLVDMLAKIPPPLVVDLPEASVAAAATPKAAPATPSRAPKEASAAHPSAAPRAPQSATGDVSNERAATLAARAEAMQIQTLAGVVGGPSVGRAIDRSNIPAVDLGAAAERNIGVTHDVGDLKLATGGPVAGPGNHDLSALGSTRTDGKAVAGKESTVAGPTGVEQVGASLTSAPIPNVDGVIAGLRGRFRRCYQTGLLSDSTMAGKVVIEAKVGPNGEVMSAGIASNAGLSPAVGQCIAGVVSRATFSAPGGGGATVRVPVTFLVSK